MKKYHDKEDYAVVVPKELLRQAERTRALFNVLLVVIAGISLVVGGIGIMNIMLATVTERTREIGIRRALGATRHDIIAQFLVETGSLSAVGGVLGIVLGVGLSLGIAIFVQKWSRGATAVAISALLILAVSDQMRWSDSWFAIDGT